MIQVTFRPMLALMLSLLLAALSLTVAAPLPVHAAAAITIDTPSSGAQVSSGKIRIEGTYSGLYDVKLYIDAAEQVYASMDDPDADDAGTWHYELDTRDYSGIVRIYAVGSDVQTRYGVWSEPIELNIDRPKADAPQVTIVSPTEGVSVNGTVSVLVSVYADMPVRRVEVRINGGAWQEASRNGAHYSYAWNTKGLGDHTSSIEARATDVRGRTGRSMTTYAKVGQGTQLQPVPMPSQDRAIWIWESEAYKLLLNPGSRLVLDSFAKDTATFQSDPVTTLYLAVGPMAGMDIMEDDPDKVRDFLAWAHSLGYQVQACIAGGTTPPYMGAYEAYHERAVREMERIINFNIASSETSKRFDGVNVDIEPYIAPDFKTNYPSLQLQYLDGLQKMIERRDASGIYLPFGPAIPKWFDSSPQAQSVSWNGQTKWLSEHVQDISDYIAIMDYRDTADGGAGIITGAQGEIDYADRIGKPRSVVVAVESLDIANSGDPETITFREEGRAAMETELDKTYAAFQGKASFAGIAMHHYDSLRTLPSYWGAGSVSWEPPADTEAPTKVTDRPQAEAVDYRQIDIRFGMALDNTDIDRYIVYRGTEPHFTPDASSIAGYARSLSFRDAGLLPNTKYYYKVAAKDLQGNIGPVSDAASAKTEWTDLQPMIVTGMNIEMKGSNAVVTMQVVDRATRQPLAGALVEGRFHFAGGKYTGGRTDANGKITLTSEAIPQGRQVGFEPRRVTAPGYYWAQAYDEPHTVTLVR
ncbi:Ig-like domain-containing protein [Paenibacillus sp. NPDC056579]|uniref:Ig-like domain-containing protein n=1 Tax=Paenibacillus sp. NPDC056579 TaxID=3345871 RepID=UPI0036B917AF